MSSTSGEINALAATTSIDFYRRLNKKQLKPEHELLMSKIFTLSWGILAIFFALSAQLVENLIEAINILGSLFYGTILGIFLIGMFIKQIRALPVFIAALISQSSVILLFVFYREDIAYLWFNLIGCFEIVIIAMLLNVLTKGSRPKIISN